MHVSVGAPKDPNVQPDDSGPGQEPLRRRPQLPNWVHDQNDRRQWREFARRNWARHPVLASLQLVCALGVAVIGLISIIGYGAHRPTWLNLPFIGFIVGSFVLMVLLVRRDDG